MDNQTFVAKYVADEATRLNASLKGILDKDTLPSDVEKDALFSDMESTLKKLTSALEYLTTHLDEETQPVA